MLKKFLIMGGLLTNFLAIFSTANAMEEEEASQRRINHIVSTTAQNVYQKINENWQYMRFNGAAVVSEFWEVKGVLEEEVPNARQDNLIPTLILRVEPYRFTEALNHLINNPATLECKIAQKTVLFFCIKELMGENHFQSYVTQFYDILNTSNNLGTYDIFNKFPANFLKLVEGEVVPGSTLYIPNVPHYSQFKPHGPGRGSNLFCVGRDQYVGFSRIYQNGPQPLQVIEEQDFMLFADPADVECDYENHSKMCQIFQKKTPAEITLFEYTRRAEQMKNHNYCHVFDGKVIEKCKNLIYNNKNISNQVGNIGMKR